MSFNKEIGMYEGYIYKITNNINDKIYIGQTSTSLAERWYQHLSKTRHKEDNSIVHKAIDKYGVEHFSILCVENIDANSFNSLKNKLNEREKYWIDELNTISPNGYNILYGGEYVPIKRRSVYQFDLNGNFLRKFESLSDAYRFLGVGTKHTKIQDCINKNHCIYGFLWSYDINDNPYDAYFNYQEQITEKKKRGERVRQIIPINQYDLDNHYIATYKNMKEPSKLFGIDNSVNISLCCKHIWETAYGFKWFYVNDKSQPDKTKIRTFYN